MKLNKDRLRNALNDRRQANAEIEEAMPIEGVSTETPTVETDEAEPTLAADDMAGATEESPSLPEVAKIKFTKVETQLIELLELETPLPVLQKMSDQLGYEDNVETLHQRYLASLQGEEEEEVDPVKAQLLELLEMGTPLPVLQKMADQLGYDGRVEELSATEPAPEVAASAPPKPTATDIASPTTQSDSRQLDDLLQEGSAFMDQEKYQQAEAVFKEATKLESHKSNVWFFLGAAFQEQEKYEEAETAYLESISKQAVLSPDDTGALSFAGLASVHEQLGNYRKAEAGYRKAIRKDPTNGDLQIDLGDCLRFQDKYQQAETAYKNGIEIGFTYSEAYVHERYGMLLYISDQSEAAEKMCRQALDEDSDAAGAHNILGLILREREAYDQAIEHFQQAIGLDDSSEIYYRNLGKSYYDQNQYAPAVEAFQMAIELESTDGDVFVDLADCYYWQEESDYKKAEETYKQAINVGFDYSAAYVNRQLSNVLRRQDKYTQAIGYAKKAIKADETDAEAYYSLGLAYYMQDGKEEEAIEPFQKAIELDPESSYNHYWLGETYRSLGVNETATEYYEKALDLDPDNESAQEGLEAIRESEKGGLVGNIIKGIFG